MGAFSKRALTFLEEIRDVSLGKKKCRKEIANLKVFDDVSITDDDVAPILWLLGRIFRGMDVSSSAILATKVSPHFGDNNVAQTSRRLNGQICSHILSALNAGAKRKGATCHIAMPLCRYLAKGGKRPSHTTNMLTSLNISVIWSIWSAHLVDTFVAHVTDAIFSPKWLVTKCAWPALSDSGRFGKNMAADVSAKTWRRTFRQKNMPKRLRLKTFAETFRMICGAYPVYARSPSPSQRPAPTTIALRSPFPLGLCSCSTSLSKMWI